MAAVKVMLAPAWADMTEAESLTDVAMAGDVTVTVCALDVLPVEVDDPP